ncbi:polysaccharide pyruvyl transferase family protein [Acidisphaera sp. S103]|uniref:polysaccharide pyruvyl transferase family protein n=1 Tax=Acidisphaera sp. S103 TaxID=1747223 RepID=UPI00131D8161|nr:polysaccharide pyruvyl transferase family protein [Acidisphaera sp. S103]
MILYRWRGVSTNFGDELNTVLWPRLLPGFFDDNPAFRFLGIGSVLDQRHSSQAVKLVAGSGYGGYEGKPTLDENWIIHWIRGPRTAAMLDLPQALALGDPAVLVPKALGLPPAGGPDIGFMPHFESAARGAWRQAAEQAGVRLIDPRDPPLTILRAIGRCKLLLSEALHGVIVADALRVPWIAIRPLARVHRAKWLDWADTMDLRPRFGRLPASTLSEWAGASALGTFHPTRTWLSRRELLLAKATPERLVVRAGQALRRAVNAAPQQSADATLDRCQSRMLDAVHALRLHPMRGASGAAPISQTRSHLQADGDSAYQLTPIV